MTDLSSASRRKQLKPARMMKEKAIINNCKSIQKTEITCNDTFPDSNLSPEVGERVINGALYTLHKTIYKDPCAFACSFICFSFACLISMGEFLHGLQKRPHSN